jgi:hypothetical protein
MQDISNVLAQISTTASSLGGALSTEGGNLLSALAATSPTVSTLNSLEDLIATKAQSSALVSVEAVMATKALEADVYLRAAIDNSMSALESKIKEVEVVMKTKALVSDLSVSGGRLLPFWGCVRRLWPPYMAGVGPSAAGLLCCGPVHGRLRRLGQDRL